MHIFRIQGALIKDGICSAKDTFELVAGLTPTGHIASAVWYGTVREGDQFFPFVLSPNGHCQYAGGKTVIRYFSIVTRPIVVGEIFELTWNDPQDKYHYRIESVGQIS